MECSLLANRRIEKKHKSGLHIILCEEMDRSTIRHFLIILLFLSVQGARKGHMYLSDALAGVTCLEGDRKFSTRSPDMIACVFRCQMVPRCGGASFDPATGQCHGCKCPVFRQDLNDLISVSGAIFYQIRKILTCSKAKKKSSVLTLSVREPHLCLCKQVGSRPA